MNIQSIKYFLTQIRKTSEDQSVSQIIQIIRNMYDIKNKQQCHSIIAQGILGILLEILLKQNIIDEDSRLEAFRLYRDLIQNEWQFKDSALRSDENLESFRLIKCILPKQLYELFIDDEDEQLIFTNLSREWCTPNLVWTQSMLKESLLIIVEYNNLILKTDQDYCTIIPITQPLFPENRNETYIQNIMLKEYNKQPSWCIQDGLLNFLEEAIDCINQSLKIYLLGHSDDSVESLKQFDRLSCKLLTQFTAFQLALEQYCFNFNHVEFEQDLQFLEEYDEQKIQKFLNSQRDAIPITIIKEIAKWMELVNSNHIRIHIYVKSLLLQVFYILSHSEVAMVILEEDELINKIMLINSKVLSGQFHKYDKILALSILAEILQYNFIVSKLEYKHYLKIYDIYTLIKQDVDILNIFKNIIASIHKDQNQMIDFSKFLLSQDLPLKANELKIFQNDQYIKKNIWRTEFDDSKHIMNYYEILDESKSICYPIISNIAIEPLPHMPDILKNRINLINSYYSDYTNVLNIGKIIDIDMNTNIEYINQTEQISIRPSMNINESEIGDDEIYS